MDLKARFLKKCKINSPTACWLWTASKSKDGYGRISVLGTAWPAHRVAYELFIGPIPKGTVARHTCKRKHCVNPAHLLIVKLGLRPRQGHKPGNFPPPIRRRLSDWRKDHEIPKSYPPE